MVPDYRKWFIEGWEHRVNYNSNPLELSPKIQSYVAVSLSRFQINPVLIGPDCKVVKTWQDGSKRVRQLLNYSFDVGLPAKNEFGVRNVLNYRVLTTMIQPKRSKVSQPVIVYQTTLN